MMSFRNYFPRRLQTIRKTWPTKKVNPPAKVNIIMHILWYSKTSFLKSGLHFSWHRCNGLALINQTAITARTNDILLRSFLFWVLTNSVPSIYIIFNMLFMAVYHNAFQDCFLTYYKLNRD